MASLQVLQDNVLSVLEVDNVSEECVRIYGKFHIVQLCVCHQCPQFVM
jgi:hypothetical protein